MNQKMIIMYTNNSKKLSALRFGMVEANDFVLSFVKFNFAYYIAFFLA